ncbi:pectinesterase inhibitor 10-like isoform X1 [Lates japonicus]|uniref:Pectinesterase inhibitor 10-like isoform X1 n=1 Tax=Lates japonicus TaxID=270547 RepID=A0AAD3M2X3_LATJO|nr:pectinesterase inhibitor 10-like isoform X1 [Lates japonicus]
MSKKFVDNVKIGVIHLLNNVLYKYWEELCYGCQINHPSQKHHECLTEIPGYFYEGHFDQLMKRLDRTFHPRHRRLSAFKRGVWY